MRSCLSVRCVHAWRSHAGSLACTRACTHLCCIHGLRPVTMAQQARPWCMLFARTHVLYACTCNACTHAPHPALGACAMCTAHAVRLVHTAPLPSPHGTEHPRARAGLCHPHEDWVRQLWPGVPGHAQGGPQLLRDEGGQGWWWGGGGVGQCAHLLPLSAATANMGPRRWCRSTSWLRVKRPKWCTEERLQGGTALHRQPRARRLCPLPAPSSNTGSPAHGCPLARRGRRAAGEGARPSPSHPKTSHTHDLQLTPAHRPPLTVRRRLTCRA